MVYFEILIIANYRKPFKFYNYFNFIKEIKIEEI